MSSFDLTFPSVTLTTSEIWPDGDAPDHPTAEDVANELRNAGRFDVLNSWNLIDTVEVFDYAGKTKAAVRL